MDVALILGARPQIIKSSSIIFEAKKKGSLNLIIIHTGQHYDYELSKVFFEEMSLPDPFINLNIGSGSQGYQTGKMLIALEESLLKIKPNFVLIPGDTNSTLAGALASAKMGIPLGHIEAGARSYDMSMPEEINRRLTDHCSTILYTVSENCTNNLLKEGICQKINQIGDTMYDVMIREKKKIISSNILIKFNLESKNYFVLTLHRPENVDDENNLKEIIKTIIEFKDFPIIFPIHPRTEKMLKLNNLYNIVVKNNNIKLVSPLGYFDNLNLIKNAKLILTDSGGMQKEAFWLETPCITIRNNTEWIETIEKGANILVKPEKDEIIKTINKFEKISNKNIFKGNPYGDGTASKKLINHLLENIK
jgi:UDP-N-acetylglucosamine 2-epimerase (non-hydrolysing)